MRFGRLSAADDDEAGRKALPIRLPLMKRNRQSAQDAKENVPPELMDDHDKADSSTKASRRRTVIDFFKHKSGHKAEAEPENILERMSTQRTKSVSLTFREDTMYRCLANKSSRAKANTDDTAVLTA